MKLNIKQIVFAGLALALLTTFKYFDLVIPTSPDGGSWIEMYMVAMVILVLVLPFPIMLIVSVSAPFLWLAAGLTWGGNPFGFFLDYMLPMMSMLVIYLARFFKNKKIKYPAIIFLILLGFTIKWFSHTLSGVLFYKVSFLVSGSLAAPYTFTTMAACMGISIFLLPRLNELQRVVNDRGMTW